MRVNERERGARRPLAPVAPPGCVGPLGALRPRRDSARATVARSLIHSAFHGTGGGMLEVELRNVSGRPLAVGSAGAHTLIVDRPSGAGGAGLGFSGGELLYLAIAGCVSNDLFREAGRLGIALESVHVRVSGEFAGDPAVSGSVGYEVELTGAAPLERLQALVDHVDRIAEIPNSLRAGTPVQLRAAHIVEAPPAAI
jgi:putative redox protein